MNAGEDDREIQLVMPAGVRRSMVRARLASVGLEPRCYDSWAERDGRAARLVLTDLAGAREAPGEDAAWIEIVDDPIDATPLAVQQRIGRFRVIAPTLDAAGLARLSAPHDDADAALEPDQWRTLDALAERNPDRVAALLGDFVKRSAGRRSRLQEFVAGGDAAILGAAAHAWKGAAAGLGADRLADALLRLEPVEDALPPRVETVLGVVLARSRATDEALRRRRRSLQA